MTSTAPDQGPRETVRRLAPLLFAGLSILLLFTLLPNLLGGGAGTATPTADSAVATTAATPGPAATPEPDTSARTAIWNQFLVHPLEAGLRFLANDLGLGAGLAIILFTILVRVVLLPLTLQQVKSQKSMQKLQPELKALQKKHGKDKEKLSAETMALYKEHGVNPAAGCFPIVLQMPVLFGLYAALNNLGTQFLPENEAFHEPWLWIAKLSQPDTVMLAGITLPGILPILAAVTQWVQQRMMTQPTDDPQQRMQNQMFQFMPLMMLWFGLSFSAGLALYWVTQNLVGIVQQYFSTGWGALLPGRTAAATAVATSAPRVIDAPAGRSSAGTDGSSRAKGSPRGGEGTRRGNGASGAPGASSGSGGARKPGTGGRGAGEGRQSSGKR